MMKKEFTTWDVFVIGLNMFVLGMLLFRTTSGQVMVWGLQGTLVN